MRGRFREICRGVNVDLGTAAVFREQWLREAEPARPRPDGKCVELLLKTDQMPGDAVAMTAAVYSLHKAYPGKYRTAIDSPWPEVWRYNPDIVQVASVPDAMPLHMHYPAIHLCNDRAIHFMQGWCEFLQGVLGVAVPLLTNRPRLYFPDPDPPTENFWVVCSGGKTDFTAKLWGQENYQRVIDLLHDRVRFVQVGNNANEHPPLRGVESMVGNTSLRELFGIIRRAKGVLCGVSLPMHVAAALDRPAVVIAGGREPVAWNAYPRQQYVHTVGAIPCRSVQGHVGQACWRSRVRPLGDGLWYDQNTCERPAGAVPLCMTMIGPDEVARLILRYSGNGGSDK